MPQISRNALVMYSDKAIFDLVNDIQRYPQFLPHCSNAMIIESKDDHIIGSVEIKKGPVCKTFTTQNTLFGHDKITMALVDGPFKQLSGDWSFIRLDEHACKVELTLRYEFSSKLIERVFGNVFKEVANNMVTTFTQRAKVIYGNEKR
jgi:ribosome-associated toxin RatA of RatAB toxin-antitoxin module